MPAVVRAAPVPAARPAAPAPVRVAPAAGPRLGLGVGSPIPTPTRNRLESALGADLSAVTVHAGPAAAAFAGGLRARAVAYGPQIVLGAGQRADDLPLMAHEAAHVLQQTARPSPQRWALGKADGGPLEAEAWRVSGRVSAGLPAVVLGRTPSGPTPQCLGVRDALDFFADKANAIPGFRMFTVVLGVNPVNMRAVDRSPANILRAVIEFIPGGNLITRALDAHGIIDKVAGWVAEQLRTLGLAGATIRDAVMAFLDSLGLRDLLDLGGVWERAKRLFSEPIDRIKAFVSGLVTGVVTLIKDAILRPLARLAEGTRGWDLLTAVLGRNPITGDPVPRTAETLIGGFMKLIGQEEVWNDLKRANAVARAWAWFQGALSGLMGFVNRIPELALAAFRSLELADLILLPRAFGKVAAVFGGFVGEFIGWAGSQVLQLLQLIFEVLAPAVMPYLRKAAGAFRTIVRNPIGFLGNLVRAGVQGFRQFAGNFLTHLRTALIGWLTGTMSGANIYIPQAFNLREIIKFVLSVLGLTWQNIRQKLVRAVGEPAVVALEAGFDIVKVLVTQGPAAAWEKILEGITNLQQLVIEQVMTFVRDRVVQAAITKLVTSLNPAGAFIQAVIAIYNTVMFFVERLRQIAQVVASVIDSLAAIAAGTIGPAANRVEQTMAGLLTLVISFLARIAGLGKVSDAVTGIINKVRAPIDRALDRVVAWIVAQARRLGRLVAGAAGRAGGGDTEASRAVKARVRADLAGRRVADAREADRLLADEFRRLRAQGLKGLRAAPDPANPAHLVVRANASATEEVARLPVTAAGAREALAFLYRFSYMHFRTVLYVYYDSDRKRYGEVIQNEPEPVRLHAEDVFARDHVAGLAARVAAERTAGTLRMPPGDRVPVLLDLNRLPCQHCSSLIPRLAAAHPGLQFTVRGATVSNAETVQRSVAVDSEAHIDFVQRMVEANVNVEPLAIFEAVWAKVLEVAHAAAAGKVKLRNGSLAVEVASARRLYEENLAETRRVRALIDEAKRRAALGRIPPQGSAP